MSWPPSSSQSKASSCSSHVCPLWRPDLLWHRRRRRRKQSSSSPSILTPSSTLLSILASLVSASAADASPTPPHFLCPSIGSSAPIPSWCHSKRTVQSGTVGDNPPNPQQSKLRPLPDKFVEGDDGIWRRVESYTLYGVTGPNPNCDPEGCPPSAGVPSVATPSVATPPPIDIQLPPGWNPSPQSTSSRTSTILAVSLALSLFICFLIVICLFWRRGLLNKKKSQDVEAKLRENCRAEEARNIEVEKEAKALQKFWARASARWKANARYSLRQRRGKRFCTRSHFQYATSLNDSRTRLAHTSRPPSISSSPMQNHNHAPSVEDPLPATSRFSSPPDYHADHQMPSRILPTTGPVSEYSASHLSRQPSHADLTLFPTSAHVATDDKTLLARLADFASVPPDETHNMSLSQVSAPEDLEFGEHVVSSTLTQTESLPSSASLFPFPPSKERLAAAEGMGYTFVYDNLDAEPELEPSAPPFEESSSMPPLDESMLFPSAPPLADENGRVVVPLTACLPSAPSLEDVLPIT